MSPELRIGQGVPIGSVMLAKQRQSKSQVPDTRRLVLFMCFPSSQPEADHDGKAGLCCSALPSPKPLVRRQTGSQSLPHCRALSARVSGRTAWVESWRLILDLETPCQQLWLGSSWAGPPAGVLSLLAGSPGLLFWSRSCLCLSCREGMGQELLCTEGRLLRSPLHGFLSPSCIKIFLSSISFQVAL